MNPGMNKKKSDVGYIYVLSNPAMPGLLKIGFTQHADTKRRVLELSKNTAVPLHFVLEFEQLIENPAQYERLIHARLNQYRLSPDKEFFKVDLDTVEKIICKIVFGIGGHSLKNELQNLASLYEKHPEFFTLDFNELNKKIAALISETKNDDELIKKVEALINNHVK